MTEIFELEPTQVKIIKSVTNGYEILVSSEDFEYLSKFKWKVDKWTKAVMTRINNKTVMMSRLIMNPQGNDIVDHKDYNTLNNQRSNLQNISQSANTQRQRRFYKTTSKYRGVFKIAEERWMANVTFSGKRIYLGSFKKEVDAALAYNNAVLKYYGNIAILNEVKI